MKRRAIVVPAPRRLAALSLAAVWLLSTGCEKPPAGAVAWWDGGHVSQQELDAWIAALPPGERRPEGDAEAWRSGQLRELAIEEIVLEEIEGEPLSPQLDERLEELRRQVAVASYLDERLPAPERPTEEELRAAYEEWLPAYRQGERRLVYHIFLSAPDREAAGAAEERMAVLRERLLAGQEFSHLAGEVSDSETRHRGGLLGWFERGQLDPRLEEVVFELPLQEPSRPIVTGSGVHLLWVEAVTGGREYSFEEVRGLVARRLANRRREEAARDLVTMEPPPGAFVPDREALRTLLREGDPGTLILRVGELELRLADLRKRLADLGAPTAPLDLVRSLEARELLYLQCRAEGCDRRPQVVERIERLERQARVEHELRQRLLARALEDRTRLEEYYARNRNRYLEPIRWRLTRAVFPLGPEPTERMRRLEAERARLDAGEITLEALAEELGGTVEALGWRTLAALRESPALTQLLPELSAGEHTPPFSRGDAFEMTRCEERLEPAPVALERVETAVAEDLLEHEGQALYRGLEADLLAAHGFREAG